MNVLKNALILSVALVSLHPYPQDNDGVYTVHRKCKARRHASCFKLDLKENRKTGKLRRL